MKILTQEKEQIGIIGIIGNAKIHYIQKFTHVKVEWIQQRLIKDVRKLLMKFRISPHYQLIIDFRRMNYPQILTIIINRQYIVMVVQMLIMILLLKGLNSNYKTIFSTTHLQTIKNIALMHYIQPRFQLLNPQYSQYKDSQYFFPTQNIIISTQDQNFNDQSYLIRNLQLFYYQCYKTCKTCLDRMDKYTFNFQYLLILQTQDQYDFSVNFIRSVVQCPDEYYLTLIQYVKRIKNQKLMMIQSQRRLSNILSFWLTRQICHIIENNSLNRIIRQKSCESFNQCKQTVQISKYRIRSEPGSKSSYLRRLHNEILLDINQLISVDTFSILIKEYEHLSIIFSMHIELLRMQKQKYLQSRQLLFIQWILLQQLPRLHLIIRKILCYFDGCLIVSIHENNNVNTMLKVNVCQCQSQIIVRNYPIFLIYLISLLNYKIIYQLIAKLKLKEYAQNVVMDKQCDDSIICLSLVITIILTIMMAFKIVNGQNMRIVIFNNHVQSVVMVNVQNVMMNLLQILINVYQFLEMDQSIHKKKNVTIHRMQYYFQQMSRQKKYIFNDQRETLKEIK